MRAIIGVFIMAGGLLGNVQAGQAQQRAQPGMAEAQRLVQLYEAGKIDKPTFDDGRYELMKKFGLQIKDTKDPMQGGADPGPMPMSPLIPIR